MVVCGNDSVKKSGIYDEVVSILNRTGKQLAEFLGITASPTYAEVLEGAKLARKHQAGLLLGVGGGNRKRVQRQSGDYQPTKHLE